MKQLVMVSVMVMLVGCGKSSSGGGGSCDATAKRFEALEARSGQRIDFEAVKTLQAKVGKDCPQVVEALDLATMGATAEVLGPGLAEALLECKCKVDDLAGFEAAVGAALK